MASTSKALLGRSAFTGKAVVHARRVQRASARPVMRQSVVVRAVLDVEEDFIQETLSSFPDKGIANVEEARVLYEYGWTYLDVRPSLEVDEVGKFKGAINIPIVNSKKVYSQEEQKKVYQKTDNPDFVKMVERKFPNKEAKIMIGCSDGRSYSLDALDVLDEAGYTNLVGLKGGYYAWFRTFDNNLRRRRYGEYAETYTHDGDSCGIHASGAGFARVDAIEHWQPPTF